MEKHGPVLAYKHAMEALHHDPGVDGIIVHLFAGFGIWSLDMKEIMSGIKEPRKPILSWLIGPEKGRELTRLTLEKEGWPTFNEIHRTVKVMASLFEHPRRQRRGLEPFPFDLQNPALLRELLHQREEKKSKILDEHESKKCFEALGLKVVKEVTVKDLDEALKAADDMGYPVVLKGMVEGKVHKTEVGLVKLNLWNVDQVKSAYQEILATKIKPKSFLIQKMLKGDLELIIGLVRDPQFGPAVMLGLGGVWAEVYKDVVFRLTPLHQEEILEMISDLKGQALFKGYRGLKPVNMESIANWLMKLGWLGLNFEKIKEIDVNPLLMVEGEPIAVDATIVLQ
jgi:acetyltransferase